MKYLIIASLIFGYGGCVTVVQNHNLKKYEPITIDMDSWDCHTLEQYLEQYGAVSIFDELDHDVALYYINKCDNIAN